MAKKKPKIKPVSRIVDVELLHWANTIVAYDSCLYGLPLLEMLPDLPVGHGIKLKVTVEVVNPGTPCPVRFQHDGETCTKGQKPKRLAKKRKEKADG